MVGPAGPIALDLDLDSGDQGQREKTGLRIGDQVTIDIVGLSGASGSTAFNVKLQYDPAQLDWVGFETADIFEEGLAITPAPAEGIVDINVAIPAGGASGDSGSLGLATFRVGDGFTGETTIELVYASYDTPLQFGTEGATVVTTGSAEPSPDFDGDGKVGFGDFVLFAQKFGTAEGGSGYDRAFDLDLSGSIGFSDFVLFAKSFGQGSGKPVGDGGPLAKPTPEQAASHN